LNIITHPEFIAGNATVNFLTQHPEIFTYRSAKDRGTKILKYLAEVSINGHPDVKHPDKKKQFEKPLQPPFQADAGIQDGSKQLLDQLGPEAVQSMATERKEDTFYGYYLS
jgi:pyruvate carboxylase